MVKQGRRRRAYDIAVGASSVASAVPFTNVVPLSVAHAHAVPSPQKQPRRDSLTANDDRQQSRRSDEVRPSSWSAAQHSDCAVSESPGSGLERDTFVSVGGSGQAEPDNPCSAWR